MSHRAPLNYHIYSEIPSILQVHQTTYHIVKYTYSIFLIGHHNGMCTAFVVRSIPASQNPQISLWWWHPPRFYTCHPKAPIKCALFRTCRDNHTSFRYCRMRGGYSVCVIVLMCVCVSGWSARCKITAIIDKVAVQCALLGCDT